MPDLYTYRNPIGPADAPCPGFIYFHGGGWVFGDLDTHDGLCRRLANASGCRVMAIDYRLAPEHKFPAAIVDGCAAATWVMKNAPMLGLDSTRIVIGGDSAGANLAALVSGRAKNIGLNFALQVLFCPVLDPGGETPSRRAYSEGYFLDEATLGWTLRHYLPYGINAQDPQVSPARAENFHELPPTHVHTAEFDPMRDEGKAYADCLARDGVAVEYTCHSGMIHNFWGMAAIIPYARSAMAEAGAAIRRALARKMQNDVASRYNPNITASV